MKQIVKFLFLLITWVSFLESTPYINSIAPNKGAITGGNTLLISGGDFLGVDAVKIANRPVSGFQVLSNELIIALVPPGTAGSGHVVVSKNSGSSFETPNNLYTYTQIGWRGVLSVLNRDNVTIFNTSTGFITSVIPLPVDSLASIITPDGTTIYAIDSTAPLIYIIDAATSTITGTIGLTAEAHFSNIINSPRTNLTVSATDGSGAFDIIVSPDGKKLYVSNNLTGYVSVINTVTKQTEANIFVTVNLGSLSITPDGKKLYVSNFNFSPNSITIIDTASNAVIGNLSTGFIPGAVSITPDGKKGYVGNSGINTVSVIDIPTNTVITTINLAAGSAPYGTAITPNGRYVYVANISNDTVNVIDVALDQLIATINFPSGSSPFWAASTPDSRKIFVANLNSSNVIPIDVATNQSENAVAAVSGQIQDIVMSPDPAPIASFSYQGIVVGLPTEFDASNSFSPIGDIASYSWDFGDGNTLITTQPIVSHTYLSENFFTVTLKVTNTAGTSTEKVFSSRFMSNNGGPTALFANNIGISSSPPSNANGVQKCCGLKAVNILTWDPPLVGDLPVAYRIYRDQNLSKLVGTVSSKERLFFKDIIPRKCKVYTYYIVAVSASGTYSEPAVVTIYPKCGNW